MLLSFGKTTHRKAARLFLASSLAISTIACSAIRPSASSSAKDNAKDNNLTLVANSKAVESPPTCAIDESVTSRGGSYSSNVNLTASIALPGIRGVDVVMLGKGAYRPDASRPDSAYAIAATQQNSGSTLHWVNPATGEISQAIDLPGSVSDLAFDGNRTLAVAVNNKVIKLDVASGKVISEIALPDVSRVAISSDGYVGAIANKTVHLYNSNNAPVFTKLRDYTEVTDVEVLSCQGTQLVYVTSFRNATFTDLNNNQNPVQIARLEALDFTGKVAWSLFSDSTDTIQQNVADTRLYRIALGKDGYLYTAGESAGTATIFRWRGQPLTEDEQYGRTAPFLTRIDLYSQLHNSASAHLPYYARVHPTKGELVTSQMSFPRLSSGKSNAMRVGDIASGSDGSVYFGGSASASILNRDSLTINGQPVGEYEKGDRTWMAIAPNFRARKFWTVLADVSGEGSVQGVDAGYGYSAALSNVKSGTVPVTRGETTGSVFLSFTLE